MLVRDPRAMLESRKNIAMMDGLWKRDQAAMLEQLEQECDRFAANHLVERDNKQIMRIIRYEDMASDPINITKAIYEFVKLEMTTEIEEFLKVATSVDDLQTNYRKGEEFLQVYSTSRKSSATINKWRMKMDFELMKKVQKRCLSMMTTFGYQSFSSESEARNVSISYF